MSKSPNIYPKVSIFWNSKEPLKLKVDCDGKLSFVSVPAIHISAYDIVSYSKDTVASLNFKQFEIETKVSKTIKLNKVTSQMEIDEIWISSTVSLKSLF